MICKLCGHADLTQVLDLGQQPLANKYPTADQFAEEEFFPLQVFFCTQCKNVQLGTAVSRARMFEDYYYLSSVNGALVKHFDELAVRLLDARFVVDIGSNDGILLAPLQRLGVAAVGVEPSVNVSKIANDKGLTTLNQFFNAECAQEIIEQFGKPDVIVASSVFTHLEDPHTFIEDVKSLLADDGRLIIEVEYIGDIIRQTQFERFYLDRIFYYSLTSLKHLFLQHKMILINVEEIEPHGGSLRVTIARDGRPYVAVLDFLEYERVMLTLERLCRFQDSVDLQVTRLVQKLIMCTLRGLKVAAYGAPARLSTICNYADIDIGPINYVVDDSPLKQGRFTPGTHIPIVGPDRLKKDPPDILVVFAYEYLDAIREKTGNKYRYVLPIPPREV